MIYTGDCRIVLPTLDAESVQCCVTSPPYWMLRNYGMDGEIGSEPTMDDYINSLVAVFREVIRVLRKDGTLWLNLGDTYNAYNGNRGPSKGKANKNHHKIMPSLPKGHGLTCKTLKAKDLMGLPWRVAFALQADGWYLRQDVIWRKPNPLPERVTDRPHRCHEYVFLFTKSARYKFKNTHMSRQSVWEIPTGRCAGHHAVFPQELVARCMLASTEPGDWILDPFVGSGTTIEVANRLGRLPVGIELNPEYIPLVEKRCSKTLVA